VILLTNIRKLEIRLIALSAQPLHFGDTNRAYQWTKTNTDCLQENVLFHRISNRNAVTMSSDKNMYICSVRLLTMAIQRWQMLVSQDGQWAMTW